MTKAVIFLLGILSCITISTYAQQRNVEVTYVGNAGFILPIHYHFTTPAFDPEVVKQNYPKAILFNKELKTWIMPDESDTFPVLKGKYLGQKPPGHTPEVFAPGIISVDSTIEYGSPTFSPDGMEVFWQSNIRKTGEETEIYGMTMSCINGYWTKPETSPYDADPTFSPDGKRLYFLPMDKDRVNGPYYVDKKGDLWSEPICMELLNRYPEIKYAYNYSLTRDGTFYFIGHAEGLGSMNDFGIYRMEFNNGEFFKPELLPPQINSGEGLLNWTPYIDPDERFILFSSNRLDPDNDFGDIYVCFRRTDGSWTEAINLGSGINSDKQERYPYVSPDGEYLFFTRWIEPGNEDVMWVSASILDTLYKNVK